MNLYLLTQAEEDGYDTFDSAIVAAETSAQAVAIHPDSDYHWNGVASQWQCDDGTEAFYHGWASNPANVAVTLIGTASPDLMAGVVLASFHAG